MQELSRVFHLLGQVFLAALIIISGASGRAAAQPQPRNAFTPEMRRHIDWLARQTLAEQHLAGFSLAIAQDGKLIYTQAYGYRNIAQHLPATPQTIYNIASITKQFTATSIMLLQEDGKLNIDDPLSKYLANYPWADQVTVRELLNHTSGIPDYLDIVDNFTLTIPKIESALGKTHLEFPPGSKYEYSNSNYVLLGLIMQRVSGLPYDDFLRRRIFEPLHLTATSVGTS
ncbi:MAG: beta-lactamase family protein, partial [Candidatus Eremiobacteraeota bacterium]|nr:beta-lactamase family protein [Candidatus Eremiobacteraeota bacterium]